MSILISSCVFLLQGGGNMDSNFYKNDEPAKKQVEYFLTIHLFHNFLKSGQKKRNLGGNFQFKTIFGGKRILSHFSYS